ncbi:unnamed protein product [Darwinula stevensoni]|uniref:Unconventional myosin-XV-like n=1 Tax=Darwinula stevensoni TaxID=69355 RepID=A0A7R8XGC1_9CRUS|nr:unnamed protein product [Darwinula stevensoni]CAG0891503.1 unnamed protein product [Darwinula stevensoni]
MPVPPIQRLYYWSPSQGFATRITSGFGISFRKRWCYGVYHDACRGVENVCITRRCSEVVPRSRGTDRGPKKKLRRSATEVPEERVRSPEEKTRKTVSLVRRESRSLPRNYWRRRDRKEGPERSVSSSRLTLPEPPNRPLPEIPRAESFPGIVIGRDREEAASLSDRALSLGAISVRAYFSRHSIDGVVRAQSLGNLSAPSPRTPPPPLPPRRRKMLHNPNPGDLVWFDPGVGYVIPGEVVEYHRPSGVITVQAVIGGKPQVFTMNNVSHVRRRQDLGQYGVEDMIQLADLNEASLVWNLKIRYDKELIYTYTGSILVSVNPYKMFDIYGLDMVKKYEGRILGTLPPHLFAIASAAYAHVNNENLENGENQAVIISGESGAGKTESTKLIMQYLAAVNKSSSNVITEQILEATPLLESFGNAKTVKNDNSSRFGKYLQLYFNNGVISGAKTTDYLLEKSRIVTHASDERNYHVFYELLKGLRPEEKEKYGLQTPDKYFYLNQARWTCEIDGKNDEEDFQSLLAAMQVLGLSMEEQDTIFRILASVLHLGNVYFHRRQLRHGQEGVEIGSEAQVKWTSHLLQLSAEGIARALTIRITEARNERVFTPLNIDQALDARDAVAKALYYALFSWLVNRVNQTVCRGTKNLSISILDIFGFEVFDENSFEQLCINYANENLQYYFSKHVFKLEQQEYAKERIDWQPISFPDNQLVIHLLAKKPVGIFHLLDDESNFPKATDTSFLEKCHYNHSLNELYSRPRMSSMEFGIKHYAGHVWYCVDGFLDKNRDTLRVDVVELLISSNIPMVSKMFREVRQTTEASKTTSKANGRFVTMKPRTPTVAARFQDSLASLLDSMSKCNPWFVRCIKPNNEKAPMKFDMPVVLEQLRYTGMLETIRIRKLGYPVRMKFGQFSERYRCLIPEHLPRGIPPREITQLVLDRIPRVRDMCQLGTHKVFLKEEMERQLEKERADILHKAAVEIQRFVKGKLAHKRYLTQREAAIRIQKQFRMAMHRHKYLKLRRGIVRAQANFRMIRQKRRFTHMKDEMKRRLEVEKLARQRTKARSAKEEADRVARAVTGVNHIDIPAELAFIFSKLDEWQPVHHERNIMKVIGHIPKKDEAYHLPNDIDYYAFSKFANVYFKAHLWGMKREPIKTPFLSKSKDSDYQESLALFKLILRFMNDSNLSGKRESVLGDYIVNKALLNEKLRDELLCQLCNQTWKNENEGNCERGWLLMANALSCFAPSHFLFKYMLKYVSDHAYNGYKVLCQKKLLQSARLEAQLARTYPPCLLEWRANRKKANMALEAVFSDGETWYGPVDSWTTGEEFAGTLVRQKGLKEPFGWSVSIMDAHNIYELNGCDYVLDLISEMEIPPAFPVCKGFYLLSSSRDHGGSPFRKGSFSSTGSSHVDDYGMPMSTLPEHIPSPSDIPTRGPPGKRFSREHFLKSRSREQLSPGAGLSRTSALNDRYFEDQSSRNRSKSLDALDAEPVTRDPGLGDSLGLAMSRLNERYHSMDQIAPDRGRDAQWQPLPLAKSALNERYFAVGEAPIDRVSEAGSEFSRDEKLSRRMGSRDSSKPNSRRPSLDGGAQLGGRRRSQEQLLGPGRPPSASEFSALDFVEMVSTRQDDQKGEYSRISSRYVKSQYAGRRYPPPAASHSSRAQIETRYSEKTDTYGMRSSALSDTSETPSLASHVRRVRVPSQASDVDQFLDDLFMPVLDGNLDELSDARSLAASIKGGGNKEDEEVAKLTQRGPELDSVERHSILRQASAETSTVDEYLMDLFQPILVNQSLDQLTNAHLLASAIKGGGKGITGIDSQAGGVTGGSGGMPLSAGPGTMTFQPISGMTSPPPVMMSPPPMLIPNLGSIPLYNPQAMAGLTFAAGTPGLGHTPLSPTGLASPVMFGSSQAGPTSPPLMVTYLPIYNAQGFSLPNVPLLQPAASTPSGNLSSTQTVDIAQLQAFQQNLQRAFLQSALTQNLQIQQQLLAQNQALQQLLQQSVSFQEQESQSDIWTGQQKAAPNAQTPQHAPRTPTSQSVQVQQSGEEKLGFSPPVKDYSTSTPIVRKNQELQSPQSAFGNVLNELKRKSSVDGTPTPPKPSGVRPAFAPPPPPPPPPPNPPTPRDPTEPRPFFDPYGRAKTVRIGKWRWPPPRSDAEDTTDSFLQFKIRQQHKKILGQKDSPNNINSSMEWEEFDLPGEKSREHRGIAQDDPELQQRNISNGIGKLQISHEMKTKLEEIHGNRSNRSSMKSEQDTKDRVVKKLEEQRKLHLQQQLGGVLDSQREVIESRIGMQKRIVPSSEERMRRPTPPQPPLIPLTVDVGYPDQQSGGYYAQNGLPNGDHLPSRLRQDSSERLLRERKASSSTQRSDRIELEESPGFLNPIDTTPVILDDDFATRTLESMKTKLYPPNMAPHLTYTRVPWKIHIRKEVFSPKEVQSNPLALHLIFSQVVWDTLISTPPCARISKVERLQMKQLLDNYGITLANIQSPCKSSIKKNIINTAKEWPCYFARLFPVTGGRQYSDVQLLAVAHSGVRLVQRDFRAPNDGLRVVDTFMWEDLEEVISPRSSLLQITLRGGSRIGLYSHRAGQIARMIQDFSDEADRVSV